MLKRLFDEEDEEVFQVTEKKSKDKKIFEIYNTVRIKDIIRVCSKNNWTDSYSITCHNIVDFYNKYNYVTEKQKAFLVRFVVYKRLEKFL